MRAMRIITGILDVLIGLLFLELVIEMIKYTPVIVARYEQEPEDLFFLMMSFPLCVFIGVVVLLAGVILLRQLDFRWLLAGRAVKLLIACAAIFVTFSVLSFAINDSLWSIFLLPVPAIAGSIYVIRKEFSGKGK